MGGINSWAYYGMKRKGRKRHKYHVISSLGGKDEKENSKKMNLATAVSLNEKGTLVKSSRADLKKKKGHLSIFFSW